MTLADRMICMNAGRFERVGSAEDLYRRPETLFAAGSIGSPPINRIAGTTGTNDRRRRRTDRDLPRRPTADDGFWVEFVQRSLADEEETRACAGPLRPP